MQRQPEPGFTLYVRRPPSSEYGSRVDAALSRPDVADWLHSLPGRVLDLGDESNAAVPVPEAVTHLPALFRHATGDCWMADHLLVFLTRPGEVPPHPTSGPGTARAAATTTATPLPATRAPRPAPVDRIDLILRALAANTQALERLQGMILNANSGGGIAGPPGCTGAGRVRNGDDAVGRPKYRTPDDLNIVSDDDEPADDNEPAMDAKRGRRGRRRPKQRDGIAAPDDDREAETGADALDGVETGKERDSEGDLTDGDEEDEQGDGGDAKGGGGGRKQNRPLSPDADIQAAIADRAHSKPSLDLKKIALEEKQDRRNRRRKVERRGEGRR